MGTEESVSIRFTSIFNRYALTSYRVCLSRRRLRGASFRLIGVILRHFFIPQFQRKRGSISRRVVYVDHALDDSIPFKPKYRPIYMSFTVLWISTIGYLYKRFGRDAEKDIFTLFRLLERSYLGASRVYCLVMTTTHRPKARRDIKLTMMHAADPHLHCVPSLHVIIVSVTWLFLDRLIQKSGLHELIPLRDLVYRQAVMITESILFMKQHSVNCVPAGLFAVTSFMKEFTPEMAEAFIDRLFTELEPDLPVREEIRRCIKDRYRELMQKARTGGGDFTDVLVDFIEEVSV